MDVWEKFSLAIIVIGFTSLVLIFAITAIDTVSGENTKASLCKDTGYDGVERVPDTNRFVCYKFVNDVYTISDTYIYKDGQVGKIIGDES